MSSFLLLGIFGTQRLTGPTRKQYAIYSKHVQYLFMNLIQPDWELESTLCHASFGIETLARRMLGNQVKPDQEFNVISIAPNTIKGVLEGQQFIWNRQTDGSFEAVIAVPPGGTIHVY